MPVKPLPGDSEENTGSELKTPPEISPPEPVESKIDDLVPRPSLSKKKRGKKPRRDYFTEIRNPLIPESLRALESVHAWIELRKSGWSLLSIARAYGVKATEVSDAIAQHLNYLLEIDRKTLEQERQIDLERMDSWLLALQKRISFGDVRAIEAGLKILERRSRLRGLDAPERQEVRMTVEFGSDQELFEEAKRLGVSIPESLKAIQAKEETIDAEFRVIDKVPENAKTETSEEKRTAEAPPGSSQ